MFKHITRWIGTGLLIAGLGLIAAGTAFAQSANGDYVITISQIDTSAFPNVTVYVSVTDKQGNPVTTVPDSAFALTENGQAVQITGVNQAGETGPVSSVLTIDRSGSMKTSGKLEAAKTAANAFIDLMRPEDQTAIVLFNTEVEVAQPLTHDQAALHKVINEFQAFNDTSMYDALGQSVSVLSGVQGRKVIVLLSDGLDNRSKQTADSIIGGLDQAETSVYTVGLGDPAQGNAMAGIDEGRLKSIAEKSHGAYTFTPDPSQLAELYKQISTRLQNEYRLTYTSPSALRDGVRRGLEVRINASVSQTNYNPGGLIPETAKAVDWPVFAAIALGLVALLALPDLIRGVGGKAAGGSRLFKKKSRIKLTSSTSTSGKPSAPPARAGVSRVRPRTKSG